MNRQDFYCGDCDSEFLIETLSMSHINYCPNCGAEQEQVNVDSYDDELEEWDD